MAILDRMMRLIRANVNDLIDQAEDPEKMLNELMREMQQSIREARGQVAEMIAQEKVVEAELNDARKEAASWQSKAELAVQRGRDDLAREALRRKNDAEQIADVYAGQLTSQQEMVAKLKQQLDVLEHKYSEAQSKRDVLIARHRRAQAQKKMTETFSTLPDLSAMSELDRMEDRILHEEARADALAEMEQDDTDWQFAELESDSSVEAELQALKASMGSGDETKSLSDGGSSSESK